MKRKRTGVVVNGELVARHPPGREPLAMVAVRVALSNQHALASHPYRQGLRVSSAEVKALLGRGDFLGSRQRGPAEARAPSAKFVQARG